MDLKIIKPEKWALVDIRRLKVYGPWHESSKKALDFAHKHHRGWDLEPGIEVTDFDSFKRLKFQRRTIPRMFDIFAKKKKKARNMADLVEFRPFRAELKKGTGEKQIW